MQNCLGQKYIKMNLHFQLATEPIQKKKKRTEIKTKTTKALAR